MNACNKIERLLLTILLLAGLAFASRNEIALIDDFKTGVEDAMQSVE